jgi:hypothetical protein
MIETSVGWDGFVGNLLFLSYFLSALLFFGDLQRSIEACSRDGMCFPWPRMSMITIMSFLSYRDAVQLNDSTEMLGSAGDVGLRLNSCSNFRPRYNYYHYPRLTSNGGGERRHAAYRLPRPTTRNHNTQLPQSQHHGPAQSKQATTMALSQTSLVRPPHHHPYSAPTPPNPSRSKPSRASAPTRPHRRTTSHARSAGAPRC